MNNKFRRILSVISAVYCILAIIFALYTAVRISPFFGFLGVLDGEEKIDILKQSAVISVTSAICCILLASDENGEGSAIKMKFSTLVWISLSAACSIVSCVLANAVSIYDCSISISAMMIFFSGMSLAAVVSDALTAKQTLFALATVFLILPYLVSVPLSAHFIFLDADNLLLSMFTLYVPLPVTLLFGFAAEMGYKSSVLSQKSRISAIICAAIPAVCHLLLHEEHYISIFKYSFLLFTAIYTVLLIFDLYKKRKRKDN